MTDNNNCGSCGHACLSAQMCVNGSCVCPGSFPCKTDADCGGGGIKCMSGCCGI
jgi:hypothetical protein